MNLNYASPFILAALSVIAPSCKKSVDAVSSLKASSADQAYYDAARDYNDAANALNSNAQSLQSAAIQTDVQTGKVEGHISSAKSFLQNLNTSITSANTARMQAEQDKARYETDEIRYNAQATDYVQRTGSLMKVLRDITQEVYLLENRINIKTEQKAGLVNLLKSIDSYSVLADGFTSDASEMQRLAGTAEQQHTDWMKQFESLSVDMKPNFSAIMDIDSYRDSLTAINDFRSKIPGTGQLRGFEKRYASSRESFLTRAQKLRELGSQISSSKDMSVYLNFFPDSKITSQMAEVEKLSRDITTVSREQIRFHDARNERRVYLSTVVPVAWEKLVKVNLQINNEKIGLEVINQAETIISSQYVYSSFLKKMNDGRNEFYTFQRTLFTPRRAGFIVADILDYLAKIEAPERLKTLSPEMRSQIVAEVQDAKGEWNRNRSETIGSLNPDKLPTFLKEWKRQAKLIGGRLKPSALTDCRKAVSHIAEAISGDATTEEAFILLKTGC